MNTVFFYAPVPRVPSTDYFGQLAATFPLNRKLLGKTFLYTHLSAEIPADLPIDQVVRLPSRQRHYPHFMRVMSWLDYLGSDRFDDDTVFLDADIILNRPIEDTFRNNFSLAFSVAQVEDPFSIINAAVIFAKLSERHEAIRRMQEIFRLAESLKLEPDPRYPQFKCAGVFGLDEMTLAVYFNQIAATKNQNAREITGNIAFDDFRPVLDTSMCLFGRKLNSDIRKISEESWHKSTVLHFTGRPKHKLFEYCGRLAGRQPQESCG